MDRAGITLRSGSGSDTSQGRGRFGVACDRAVGKNFIPFETHEDESPEWVTADQTAVPRRPLGQPGQPVAADWQLPRPAADSRQNRPRPV